MDKLPPDDPTPVEQNGCRGDDGALPRDTRMGYRDLQTL